MTPLIRLFLLSLLIATGSVQAADNERESTADKPTLSMNVFSPEAQLRTQLFESISKKHGFRVIAGRFGGEFNNDQLAIKEQDGRTILLLGLKVTSPTGDLQLDQMSMGPFPQLSADWLTAVIQCLRIDRQQYPTSFLIELARNTKKLDLVVLLLDKTTQETKFLGITTPN